VLDYYRYTDGCSIITKIKITVKAKPMDLKCDSVIEHLLCKGELLSSKTQSHQKKEKVLQQ
jgi:hypothetical protein